MTMRTRPAPILRVATAMVVLSLAAVACASTKDTGFTRTGADRTTATAPATSAAAETRVELGDIFFRPSEVHVKVGTKVVWLHVGNLPHTVTADNGSFDSSPGCPADSSKCLQKGSTFEQTFKSVSRIPYYCKIHGAAGGVGQAGVIVVEA